jgi:hypothetical protein
LGIGPSHAPAGYNGDDDEEEEAANDHGEMEDDE